MSHKHTAGEWQTEEDADLFGLGTVAIFSDGEPVAHVEAWAESGEDAIQEARANAFLIAAAPNLLAACIALLEDNERLNYKAINGKTASLLARAAILKAVEGILT